MAETIVVAGETKRAEREDAIPPPTTTTTSGLANGPSAAAAQVKSRRATSETPDTEAAGAAATERDRTVEEKLSADRAASGFEAAPATLNSEARAHYDTLVARTARRASEARELREAWRVFARVHAKAPEADEARVRSIEAGVLAWRLARDLPDLYVVHADAQSYLSTADAPQSERVRKAIRGLPSP